MAPHASFPSSGSPSARRRAVIAALALVLSASVAACGGGSSDAGGSEPAASAPATSAPASDDGSNDAAATTTAGASDLDVCAEVTAEDVGAVLTGADISEAAPNNAFTAPNCAYDVTWAGSPLSVVQILWNEDGYLDAQRQSNPTATEVEGLDAIAISDSSIVIAGESGDFQVDGGIELSEGGDVATKEQLVAIAELVQGL